MKYSVRTACSVLFVLMMLVSVNAFGQLNSGALYGTVVDEGGFSIPGVLVTLNRIGSYLPLVQITKSQGSFRFLNLLPGVYTAKAEIEGFSTALYPNVTINADRNTTIEFTLMTPGGERAVLTDKMK